MSDTRRYTLFWVVAEKASRLLTGAFVTAAVARYLGPTEYGSLSVAAGVVAIAVATAGLGAQHIELSELSRRSRSDAAAFMGSALAVRAVWALFCFSALIGATYALNISHENLVLILSAGVLAVPPGIIGGRIQSQGQFATFSILAFSSNIVGALLRIAGILFAVPLTYFAVAYAAEACFFSLLLIVWQRRAEHSSLHRLSFAMTEASSYFRLCIPTAASITLVIVYFRVELFLIDFLIGKAAAGIWAASLMFTAPWGIVASSIVPFANRRLVMIQADERRYRHELAVLLRQMYMFACFAIVVNILAVKMLAPLLLGDKYAAVADIVAIGSFSLLALFSGSVQELWIAHNRSTGTVLKKVMISLPVSIALYFMIVPRFGLLGAAGAMVISHFVTTLLLNVVLDRGFFRVQLHSFGILRTP